MLLVYSETTIWAVEVSFGDNGTELIGKPTEQYSNNTAVFVTNNHQYTQVCVCYHVCRGL